LAIDAILLLSIVMNFVTARIQGDNMIIDLPKIIRLYAINPF
jgi:hypothetical protein